MFFFFVNYITILSNLQFIEHYVRGGSTILALIDKICPLYIIAIALDCCLLMLILSLSTGDWEQAYSRKDKKNKKKEEETPSKKSKKTPKKADLINEAKQKEQEKLEIKDLKEIENKESKEEKEVILTPISDDEIDKEKESQKEEEIKVRSYLM